MACCIQLVFVPLKLIRNPRSAALNWDPEYRFPAQDCRGRIEFTAGRSTELPMRIGGETILHAPLVLQLPPRGRPG